MSRPQLAQGLHDHRVHKTRGKQVSAIPRTCLECKRDATPRYAYCSDACSEASRRRIFDEYARKKYGR